MAGIQPVQLVAQGATNGTTNTIDVEEQTSAGNVLVAAWRGGSGHTLTAITDSQDTEGDLWTIVTQSGGTAATSAIAIRPLQGALGLSDTITTTTTGTTANDVTIWSYSGVDLDDPIVGSSGNHATSTSSITNSITPDDSTNAIMAAVGTGSATATVTSDDGLFTARGVGTNGINLFDLLPAGTTDTITEKFDVSPGTNLAVVFVALRAATSTGTTYNDAPVGTFSLSGSSTDSRSGSDSVTGSLTLAGTSTEHRRASDTMSGSMSLSGVATDHKTTSTQPIGAFTLAGSIASSHTANDAPVGYMRFVGTLASHKNAPKPTLPTTLTLNDHESDLTIDAHTVLLTLDVQTTGLVLDDHTTVLALDDHDTSLSLND